MSDFSLACYTVRVKKKEDKSSRKEDPTSRKNSYRFLRLDGSPDGIDLFSFLENFLNEISVNPKLDESNQILMTATSHSTDAERREIVGILESGKYGLSSNLVDRKTFQIVHERAKDEAELLPFYFLLLIPETTDEAVLMLGRIGSVGVRKNLAKFITKPFEEEFKNCEIVISPLIIDAIIEQYLTAGTIKSLNFIKFNIPHDRIDSLEDGHMEVPISREITYHVKDRSQRFPIKPSVFTDFLCKPKSERRVNQILELKEADGDYDTIKVEVDFGGSTKTINLDNFSRVRSYFDISKDPNLVIDSKGYPTFESINEVAHVLCKKLLEIMYR
jgi:hypothetical protein